MPTDEQIMDEFQHLHSKNEFSDVIKELFNEEKLFMITDISEDEIKLITRILVIAKLKKISTWEEGIKMFLKLKLSKKRMSRKEILESIRGYGNSMQRMNPFSFGRNNQMR